MSQDKNKPLQERVNRKQVRDSASKAAAERKAYAEELRKKNANKPGYDKDGNPLSVKEKATQKEQQERAGDWQNNPDFDREKGGWAPDPSQGVAGDAFTVWDALSITKAPLRGAASLLIKAPNMLKGAKKWYNKGRTPAEDKMSWRDLLIDDWKQRGKPGDGTKGGWDPTRGFRPGVKASEGGFGSGPTPLIRQVVERGLRNRLKVKPDDLGI
tara:strand:+ start:545 stop:1183 length:639 start_codon:yes stop_codon:yes gene_type:complete